MEAVNQICASDRPLCALGPGCTAAGGLSVLGSALGLLAGLLLGLAPSDDARRRGLWAGWAPPGQSCDCWLPAQQRVFNKGTGEDCANYRPASVIGEPGRIMEKIILGGAAWSSKSAGLRLGWGSLGCRYTAGDERLLSCPRNGVWGLW